MHGVEGFNRFYKPTEYCAWGRKLWRTQQPRRLWSASRSAWQPARGGQLQARGLAQHACRARVRAQALPACLAQRRDAGEGVLLSAEDTA